MNSDVSPKIQINYDNKRQINEELERVLADTYVLYLITQNFHWNVTGNNFHSLHLLFESQYKELAEAIDLVAERIRTLGFLAPGSFEEFSSLSEIKFPDKGLGDEAMLNYLAESNESVARSCRKALVASNMSDDESSSSILSDRIHVHEKSAWMLRASIQH